jgi:hypothetical protein
MTTLTERLNELSARTKKTEQLVDAARTFNRATLQARQAELLTSLDAGQHKMEDAAASARSSLGQWWEEMRALSTIASPVCAATPTKTASTVMPAEPDPRSHSATPLGAERQ